MLAGSQDMSVALGAAAGVSVRVPSTLSAEDASLRGRPGIEGDEVSGERASWLDFPFACASDASRGLTSWFASAFGGSTARKSKSSMTEVMTSRADELQKESERGRSVCRGGRWCASADRWGKRGGNKSVMVWMSHACAPLEPMSGSRSKTAEAERTALLLGLTPSGIVEGGRMASRLTLLISRQVPGTRCDKQFVY